MMDTRYDIGLAMQSADWQYGSILGDYSTDKLLKMCDYSVLHIVKEVKKPFYKEYISRFYGNSVVYGSAKGQYDIFLDGKRNVFDKAVLYVPKVHWKEIAMMSSAEVPKQYMLTYIANPDEDKRKVLLFYRSKLELPCRHIVDGNYPVNKKILNLRDTLPRMSFADFVKYTVNADFVITDDYYMICLAVSLNKPFIYLGEDDKTADLLAELSLNERVIFDTQNFPVNNRLLQPVNFARANQITAEQSKKMLAWIKNRENLQPVQPKITDKAITDVLDLNLCVGCSACVNRCPKGALSLKPDRYGYYCTSIDKDKCINCGLCTKVCPVLEQPVNTNRPVPNCYSFVASDEPLVMQSSSGGIFSLLAREVLQNGGVVAGGAWKDDFTVEHIIIDKPEDLPKLRKSKYLQSYLGDVYQRVKQYLDEERLVLFSGCGCQVAGLKKYLKKDYNNLLTVDIFCHYSPSPMFFKKYIEGSFDNLQKYEFRHKNQQYGWDCFTVQVNDDTVRHGSAEDEYQRVFHSELMLSEHCANCRFQSRQRYGDISLGDFWNIQKHDTDIPYGKGVSCVFVNNEKGQKWFESIPDSAVKWKKKVPVEWVGGNGFIYEGKNKPNQKQKDFYRAIRFMPFEEAANYALKPDRGMKTTVNGSQPLQFDSKILHFRFDGNIWEEHFKDNAVYLTVKDRQAKPGEYAVLPLCGMLDKNKHYQFHARFRFKSDSKVLYFHIKDSGSKSIKVIAAHKAEKNTGQNWIELHHTFTPPSNIFDELVFGASQVKGEGAFIAIDYLYITELDE